LEKERAPHPQELGKPILSSWHLVCSFISHEIPVKGRKALLAFAADIFFCRNMALISISGYSIFGVSQRRKEKGA